MLRKGFDSPNPHHSVPLKKDYLCVYKEKKGNSARGCGATSAPEPKRAKQCIVGENARGENSDQSFNWQTYPITQVHRRTMKRTTLRVFGNHKTPDGQSYDERTGKTKRTLFDR